ncbi:alpha-galactosidase [Spongisporangium articulatum]|uniref:alpha-galactosidase n=1 Tax=Spongisporangium articulatum TaxID=3362603 RepID=A0ABW8ALM0_9ACTN
MSTRDGRGTADATFLLRAAGASLLIDARGDALPEVVHWGPDLGELDARARAAVCDTMRPAVPSNTVDVPRRVGLLPTHATGYPGRATLTGSRAGAGWSPSFRTTSAHLERGGGGEQRLTVQAVDDGAQLELVSELRLGVTGVLQMRHAVLNAGDDDYELLTLPGALPIPVHATELLDVTGRHLKERIPQRMPLNQGAWVREQRRGRTGTDAPLLLAAGTSGFGFRHGEVWAVHLGWSGNFTVFAERLNDGWGCLGAGELLDPDELVLAPGERYEAPWLYAVYSGRGLDGVSDAHHAAQRARPRHPSSPRPVNLNTWEAVYFDHDLETLKRLADAGAEVGAERFVLDDGWFGSRRDDHSGLGDWYVSADVWPDGLDPLISHVRGLGMVFGLWVEPEMVNPDSDLARTHPDWVLAVPGRTPPLSRHQQVLDLGNPEAYDYIHDRLHTLLDEYDIGYLKWDHNRDLVDAASSVGGGRRPGVHAQTLALYRLLDQLRAEHPDVEIESCSSGGGRVDLGILQRTDRIWTSDCNDPLERQQIERYTGLVVAPELMGSHVGPPRAHTTARHADLGFRAGTALFGHFGIEWDLAAASPAERGELAAWIALYKRFRPLLHGGVTVRAEQTDPGAQVRGVVSPDGREALFACVQLATTTSAPPPPWRLPGLDAGTTYHVEPLLPGPEPVTVGTAPPPWWPPKSLTLPGSVLEHVGLPSLLLAPQQVLVLHLTARP